MRDGITTARWSRYCTDWGNNGSFGEMAITWPNERACLTNEIVAGKAKYKTLTSLFELPK